MLESSESPELAAAVKVGVTSNVNVLASDVESYSPTCLPPSIMSMNKLPSLFTIHAGPYLPTAPHKFPSPLTWTCWNF